MTEAELRFHLEEYKALRAEIATYVKYTFDFFLYAAAGSGLIAAWLLTHRSELNAVVPVAGKVAAFIPLILAVLAYMAVLHLIFVINRTARYCARVETVAAVPGLGWETFIRADKKPSVPLVTTATQNGSWLVLIVADAILALFL